MSGRRIAVTGWSALVLLSLASACGSEAGPFAAPTSASASSGVQECQEQWHDVAESVIGLDQDTDPSALASRWTSVIATVDYYETSTASAECQATIESQVRAISTLRQFSERLRPYDMAYQQKRVQAAVDLYLHDPVPAPVKGPTGKLVKAPSHAAVEAALATLTAEAGDANAELLPAWRHLASVTLEDEAAVTAALEDLDALARAGEHWTRCQEALQVITAATRAQEGLLGKPEAEPSSTATPIS